MIEWLPLFMLQEEENLKKQEDPNYESPHDIDITEISGWVILISVLIGLSPFVLAFVVITIEKLISS